MPTQIPLLRPFLSSYRWIGLIALLISVAGCTTSAAPAPAAKPAEVRVALPTIQSFVEHEDFSGRVEARESVLVRARVSGYLDEVKFADGAQVRAGDPLFVIDPRPYQADMERSEAVVAQTSARMKRMGVQFERSKKLVDQKAISQEDFDVAQSDYRESVALYHAAEATRDLAQLNLGFTEVRAPLSGRLGRRLADVGNLIKADDTMLVSLLSLDPIYVSFDVDERTVLRIRRQPEAAAKASTSAPVILEMSLADKDDFSIRGSVDFTDNQLDGSTGTLRMRATVDNKAGLLSPGMFVRCRYPIGAVRDGLFVPEEALGTDQGQPFLYVVNSEDVVEYRSVKLGPLIDGRRVIESNLCPEDRVIVSGLQRVRTKAKVVAKLGEGPVTARSTAETATSKTQ
jgi:RND family efflux transporter MFP subunit